MGKTSPDHGFEVLDGLRGVAILMVFCLHVNQTGVFSSVEPLQRVFNAGWLGVDLFFVLSGFLITKSALSLKRREGYHWEFFKRRALRILPAYLVALTILFPLTNLAYAGAPDLADMNNRIPGLLLLVSNVQMLIEKSAVPHHLTHFWSLAVEAQIYLLWGLAVGVLPRRGLIALAVGMVALSVAMRASIMWSTGHWMWAYFATPARLDAFALGAIAFLMMDSRGAKALSWMLILAAALLAAVIAKMEGGFGYASPWAGSLAMTAMGCGGAGLVLAFVNGRLAWPGRILSFAPLKHIGRISFSMYLYHDPVIGFCQLALKPGTLGRSGVMDAAFVLATLLLSVLVAQLSYTLIEAPLMHGGRGWRVLRVA